MRVNGSFNSQINSVSQRESELAPKEASAPPVKTGVGATSDAFDSENRSTKGEYDTKPPGFDPTFDAGAIVTPDDLGKYFGEFDKPSTEPTGPDHLNSILNDPSLPFEEKLALFLFDFLDKAQKDLLTKMEQLDKSRNVQKTNGGTSNQAGQGSTIDGGAAAQGQGAVNGQTPESEQIAMEKLKLAHEKMNKMFSIVDNILTSNNRTVKEGPIAALKG